jgi:3-oxoacyl-[acyl-carrier-protein] synthase II
MSNFKPVAITGMGCICSVGSSVDACMTGLFSGTRETNLALNPKPPTRFKTDHSVKCPVFEVRGFADVDRMLRTSALGLHAAREAIADAGLDQKRLSTLRVGVCMGTTVGCAINDESFCRAYRAGEDPDLAPMDRILNSNPAAVIAQAFGFRGPCQTVVNACSSSTDAIGLGAAWLASGLCDMVVSGGADELSRITFDGFISLKIASSEPCKPFDLNRRGLNLGEGAAVVILESEESRKKRKRRARSFLLGYGSACDAYHQTAPHPEGAGLKRAIAEALACSGTRAGDLAFVNAHGTGTPDNDRTEGKVLAETLPGVPFMSTKGFTGHTLGAAGAIEAVFTAACLEAGKAPANIGFQIPDPEMGVVPTTDAMPLRGATAMSQSLAFGGNNSVVVLGKGDRP